MKTKVMGAVATLLTLSITTVAARDLTASEKKIVSDAVTRDFKDPASAMFRWLPIGDIPPDGQSYCGMVNGKNSYGAYNGYEPFLVFLLVKDKMLVSAMLLTMGNPSDSASEQVTFETCQKNGQDPRAAK